MPDFKKFEASMNEAYEGRAREALVSDQWARLTNGERGIAICDAALVAWSVASEH